MSEGGDRKRKSKGWYRKQAYHNKRAKCGDGEHSKAGHRLAPGLKGFIVTCNDRERDAVKETYNILNEYADKLYGPETKPKTDKGSGGDNSDDDDDDDDDIEAAIAKEVQGLKDAASKGGERRFQNSQSGAKNCIFIKTSLGDPAGLALAIFRDLRERKVQKSRYALRLLPVVGTCKATVKDINALAKEVLPPFFTTAVDTDGDTNTDTNTDTNADTDADPEVTFTVTFKARNNNGLGRDAVVSTLRQTIEDSFTTVPLRFTYSGPRVTVLVEVMCGVACIAVARDFALYKKYNLVEVALDRSESGSAWDTQTADKKKKEEEDKSRDKAAEKSEHCLEKAADSGPESCEKATQKNLIISTEKKEEMPAEDNPTEKFSDESKNSQENILRKDDAPMESEKSVEKTDESESTDREKEAAPPESMSAEKSAAKEEETSEAASAGEPTTTGEAAVEMESKETRAETVQKVSQSQSTAQAE